MNDKEFEVTMIVTETEGWLTFFPENCCILVNMRNDFIKTLNYVNKIPKSKESEYDDWWLIKHDIPDTIYKKSLLGIILLENAKDIFQNNRYLTFVTEFFFITVWINIYLTKKMIL